MFRPNLFEKEGYAFPYDIIKNNARQKKTANIIFSGGGAISLSAAVLAVSGAVALTPLFVFSTALLFLGARDIARGIAEERRSARARVLLFAAGPVGAGLSASVILCPLLGFSILVSFIAADLVVVILVAESYISVGATIVAGISDLAFAISSRYGRDV